MRSVKPRIACSSPKTEFKSVRTLVCCASLKVDFLWSLLEMLDIHYGQCTCIFWPSQCYLRRGCFPWSVDYSDVPCVNGMLAPTLFLVLMVQDHRSWCASLSEKKKLYDRSKLTASLA